MATTTNYSWTTPDDTDLVKDGAAAIRTLGSSADTTVKALNPGTTAGDIDYYTTSTAKARVGIGTAGQVLQVNSGATAPEWATPSSGGMTLISTTTLSGTTTALNSIPSTYKHLQIIVRNPDSNNNPVYMKIRMNSDGTASRHKDVLAYGLQNDLAFNDNAIDFAFNFNTTTTEGFGIMNIYDYTNTTTFKVGDFISVVNDTTDATQIDTRRSHFAYNQIGAISSLLFVANVGSFTAGTVELYGVK